MFSLFLSFSFCTQIAVGTSGTSIDVPSGFVLIAENPKDFTGTIELEQSDGSTKKVDVFGTTPYFIINFTSTSSSITIKPIVSTVNTFYYQIFYVERCTATEIYINPPNGYKGSVSTHKGDKPTYHMTEDLRVCFWYLWNPSYKYTVTMENDGISIFDEFEYAMDTESGKAFSWREVDDTETVHPQSTIALYFESSIFDVEGSGSVTFSTNSDIKNSVRPNLSNCLCIGRQCYWTRDIPYEDGGLSGGAIAGIVIAVVVVVAGILAAIIIPCVCGCACCFLSSGDCCCTCCYCCGCCSYSTSHTPNSTTGTTVYSAQSPSAVTPYPQQQVNPQQAYYQQPGPGYGQAYPQGYPAQPQAYPAPGQPQAYPAPAQPQAYPAPGQPQAYPAPQYPPQQQGYQAPPPNGAQPYAYPAPAAPYQQPPNPYGSPPPMSDAKI